MPLSVEQFTERLIESRLMSADEIASYQDHFPPTGRPRDGDDLKNLLLRDGKLTSYQAAAIEAGKTKGLVLGIYRVLDQIGSGKLGDVFKAEHQWMERVVAIKVLPERLVEADEAFQRFQREAKASAKLEHPNIVRAHDADEDNGVHFLVMQYVEGRNLQSLIDSQGPLPVAQAIDYVIQAARGLEYAHQVGVLHRDVKPSNLLVDQQGTVKILDMGLARMDSEADTVRDREGLTQTGAILGTADYMSPEQAEDPHSSDHRSDIYSLGCTLFFLLSGRVPYPRGSAVNAILAHREEPAPSLCESCPDATPELDAIFKKMIAKNPADRYNSMTEVITALRSQQASLVADQETATFIREEVGGERVPPKGEAVPRLTVPRVERVRPEHRPHEPRHVSPSRGAGARRLRRFLLLAMSAVCLIALLAGLSAFLFSRGQRSSVPQRDADVAPVPTLAHEPFDRDQARNLRRQWSGYLKTDPSFANTLGMQFVLVPPGQFTMGSSDDEVRRLMERGKTLPAGFHDSVRGEAPAHSVTIPRAFYMGVHEVTVGQFREFVKTTGYQTSAESSGKGGRVASNGQVTQRPDVNWQSAGFEQSDDHPVVQVSWSDTEQFCAWLSKQEGRNYRLPTEAEWEYACRAGTTTRWHSGDDEKGLRRVAHFADARISDRDAAAATPPESAEPRLANTARVGNFAANNFDLYDIHGNVFEYCYDWYQADYYRWAASFNTPGPYAGDGRVARGGGWNDGSALLRSAFRIRFSPDEAWFHVGFRVVCEVPFSPAPQKARTGDEIPASLKERAILRGHTGKWVGLASFSPDGRRLATPGWDTTVRLWEVASAVKERSLLGHMRPVVQALFSPDGRMLASSGEDSVIKLWDATNGHNFADLAGHGGAVSCVAFSPDGRTLASGGQDKTVRLWNLASYASKVLEGHEAPVQCVSFSPDGRTLASAGNDATVRFWHAETGQLLAILENHPAAVLGIDFSPRGDLLAAGCGDGTIQLWDTKSKAKRTTLFDWDKGPLRQLQFAPGGRVLASAGPGPMVTVWDWRERRVLAKLPTTGEAVSVAFSNDGNRLTITSEAKEVSVWDLAWAKTAPVEGVTVHRAGAEQPRPPAPPAAKVQAPKTVSLSPREPPVGPDAAMSQTALAPQPAAVKGLRSWTVETRRHRGKVSAVAALPSGRQMAAAGRDGAIRVWSVPDRNLEQILLGHAGEVTSLCWSPDGHYLASAGSDATVRIWQWPSGKLLNFRRNPAGIPLRVSWSPDGAVLSYSDGLKLWLWDLESDRELVLVRLHGGGICWGWSGDARFLAASGSDSQTALWDAARLRAVLEPGSARGENLLPNPSFEDVAGEQPRGGWSREVISGSATCRVEQAGRTSERSLAISSGDGGDAVWFVNVDVKPETVYRLSGWIKARDVRPQGLGLGAFLNIQEFQNTDRFTTRVLEGTSDWSLVEILFDTLGRTRIRVNCTLGGWGDAVGTAWFDDLALTEVGRLDPDRGFPTYAGPVRQILWSPDGGSLATVTKFDTIQLWNSHSAEHLQTFATGATSPGELVASWSPDGSVLAGADANGSLLFWDRRTGELRDSVRTSDVAGAQALAWLDDKTLLSAAPDGTLSAHNTDSRRHEKDFLEPVEDFGLAVSADGHFRWGPDEPEQLVYVVREQDGTSELFTIQQFADRFGWKNDPQALALPVGSSRALIPSSGRLVLDAQPRVSLAHPGLVRAVAFSPAEATLATTCEDGNVRLWDVTTGLEKAVLEGHKGPVHFLAFSPDGSRLASAGEDQTVRIWDAAAGRPVAGLHGHQAAVYCVVYSPDGNTVATASGDLTIKLWDAARQRLRLTMAAHHDGVTGLAFSHRGRWLASAGLDHAVKLWDVASGAYERTLHGHSDGVIAVAFSLDDRTLASGGAKEGKLWDVDTGRELASLHHGGKAVHCVAFGPDGHTLASGGHDGTLRLWDFASSREVDARAGTENIFAAAFSSDGKLLAVSADNLVRIWDVQGRTAGFEN